MIIPTDWLTWFFIIYCTIPNFTIVVIYALIQIKEWLIQKNYISPRNTDIKLRKIEYLTMLIPAHNEQKVLDNTVRSILASVQNLEINCEILIINDGSTDDTGKIIDKLIKDFPKKILLVQRSGENAKKGKAEALNAGIDYLKKFIPDRSPTNWIIGVSDADGQYSHELFNDVLSKFEEENCDAVQCAVRIKNNHSMLTKFQDLEFLAFSKVVQKVREHLDGTVFLGGNAQFIIFQKLLDLYEKSGFFWQKEALTEDLDISIRLHMLGSKVGFSTYPVNQEGVETIKALFRQRKRWARGTIQAFRQYILSLKFYTSSMPLAKKMVIFYYLTFWIVPLIVGATIIIGWPLVFWGKHLGIFIQNSFPLWLMLLNSFSFLPLVIVGMKIGGYSWLETFFLGLLSPFYSYHWFWPVVKGCVAEFKGEKVVWQKTERFANPAISNYHQGG